MKKNLLISFLTVLMIFGWQIIDAFISRELKTHSISFLKSVAQPHVESAAE